jgi:hypothetical protein
MTQPIIKPELPAKKNNNKARATDFVSLFNYFPQA